MRERVPDASSVRQAPRLHLALAAVDLTPECAVAVAGEDVTDRLRQALVELRVVSTADRTTDTVEITLAGDAGSVIAAPPTGRELRISLGYRESGLVDLGRYWHTETEIACAPQSRVVVRATGADLRANAPLKSPRTHAWHDTTLGAVLEQIAGRNALTLRVDAALASLPVPHEDQTDESDLHLVRRLAVLHGATAKVVGPDLVFAPAGAGRSASGDRMPHVSLTPTSDVVDLRVAYRDRPKVASVRARYWRLVEAAPRHSVAGDGDPPHDLPGLYPDEPTATAAAAAAWADFRRATGALEATVPGNPTLSAGAQIVTAGWPTAAANRTWTAAHVTHTLDRTGYKTAAVATAVAA